MKKCTVCSEVKSLDEFHNRKDSKDGKYAFCKICKNNKDKLYREANKEKVKLRTAKWVQENSERSKEYHRQYRKNNKENKKQYDQEYRKSKDDPIRMKKRQYSKSRSAKDSVLKRNYGISLEEYEKMVDEQNNVCYICLESDSVKLAVDHNHKTGKVRKLLCRKCNTAIGLLKEDITIVENVLKYIKHFS